MKAFTLHETVEPGIRLFNGRIKLGDTTHGSSVFLITPPKGSVIQDGTLMELMEGYPQDVLLLVRNLSGKKGGWRMIDARSDYEWDAIAAASQDDEDFGEDTDGTHLASWAFQEFPEQWPKVEIIGFGVQQSLDGAAARGQEMLIVMHHKDAVEIVRTGELEEGQRRFMRVECRNGSVELRYPDIEASVRRKEQGPDDVLRALVEGKITTWRS